MMKTEPIPPLPLGLTVRLRDSRLAIVMVKPFICCDGLLQILDGPGIAEVPATCTTCGLSQWWWGRDVLPVCRVCVTPPATWEFDLLPRAIAAMKQLNRELVEEGTAWMERAFISGDVDALQRIEGLAMVQEELRKTYSAYFERKAP